MPSADTVLPSATWAFMGETDGGVTITATQTVDEHTVDQAITPIRAIRSAEGLTIVTNLAIVTLENLGKIFGNLVTDVAPGTGTKGYRWMDLYRGPGDVPEKAIVFEGPSPYVELEILRFWIPRGAYFGDMGLSFVKDSKVLIPIEFHALLDPTNKFGKVYAVDQAAS
jgi:hypothetical protein